MAGRPLAKERRRLRDKYRVMESRAREEMAQPPGGTELQRRSAVRSDMRYLVHWYFKGTDGKPFRLADYHVEILEAMFEGGYLIINVPTDHAKSTLGCFLFPLLSLMENPEETHLICGANLQDSKRRVQALEREIETNELLIQDFPWMRRPDPEGREDRLSSGRLDRVWTATQFNVGGRTINKPNPSVLGAAIGSNDLRGRRGKLICDDVEGEDVRWSPTKRDQLESWLKLEAWRCFEDRSESERPLLCLLGTPFDVDSIYFRMERQNWKTIRYACYVDGGFMAKEPPLDSNGRPMMGAREYLWPEKVEKVEKAKRSLSKLEFSIAYLMDPTGGDPSRLSMAQIQERISSSEPIEAEQWSGFVTLDPAAGGIGKRLDYAGIAVVRINWPQGDELPRLDLLECHEFSQGLFEQVHFCSDLAQRYGYPVLVEANSQQGGVYSQTFQHLHPEVKLLRHYTTQANKFGDAMGPTIIRRLAVESLLWVPEVWREADSFITFVKELRDLQPPYNQHNHISMAVWFAVRYVYERVRHAKVSEVRSTYAQDPRAAIGDIWKYLHDPGLHPLERAKMANEYDRMARSGLPMIVGYTAWGRRQEMPWDRALREEQERFEEALKRPRAS